MLYEHVNTIATVMKNKNLSEEAEEKLTQK